MATTRIRLGMSCSSSIKLVSADAYSLRFETTWNSPFKWKGDCIGVPHRHEGGNAEQTRELSADYFAAKRRVVKTNRFSRYEVTFDGISSSASHEAIYEKKCRCDDRFSTDLAWLDFPDGISGLSFCSASAITAATIDRCEGGR